MTTTIGRHWKADSPRGDYTAQCSICGSAWPRSQLVRKADGNWYCPNDVKGMDAVTLSRGNAAGAARRRNRVPMDAPVPTKESYTPSLPDDSFLTILPRP